MLILHLSLALLAALTSVILGLAAGQPVGILVLLYVGGGHLGFLASVVLMLLTRAPRNPGAWRPAPLPSQR